MNIEKKGGIIGGLEVLVALFMMFAVTKLAPVCSGMLELVSGKQVHMKCYYAGVALVYLAILFAVCGVLLILKDQKLVGGIITVVIGIMVYAILKDNIGIGVCANPDMACQMTAPYARVCATVEIILGLASVILSRKNTKEK